MTDWSKASLDAEFGPIESADRIVIPTVLSRWFLEFRDDVLTGRVPLEELIELVDADHQDEAIELCPTCSRRPVRRPRGSTPYRGMCSVCWLNRLRDAHLEHLAVLEARAAVATTKKATQRAKDELDPDRTRRHRPFRTCVDCGERLPARTTWGPVPGDERCQSCRDLLERRHPEKHRDEACSVEPADRSEGGPAWQATSRD